MPSRTINTRERERERERGERGARREREERKREKRFGYPSHLLGSKAPTLARDSVDYYCVIYLVRRRNWPWRKVEREKRRRGKGEFGQARGKIYGRINARVF